MQKEILTTTRLDGPKFIHKLHEARHLWGTTPLIVAGILWGIAWIVTDGTMHAFIHISLLIVMSMSGTFLALNLFFVKAFPDEHALVDAEGNIVFDPKRANIAMWRWEYKKLLKGRSLVAYKLNVHDMLVKAEMRQYRILFLTGCSLEESRELEKTLKELTVMNLRTPEDVVKVNFYDVLRDYPQVIADLRNPLRTEEQETFRKLLCEHLLTRLTSMGIKVVPKCSEFSWA